MQNGLAFALQSQSMTSDIFPPHPPTVDYLGGLRLMDDPGSFWRRTERIFSFASSVQLGLPLFQKYRNRVKENSFQQNLDS